MALYVLHDEIERLRARVEELKLQRLQMNNEVPITTDKSATKGRLSVSYDAIDAAWRVMEGWYDTHGGLVPDPSRAIRDALKVMGIVECEKCSGSGEIEAWTDCLDWVNCPGCHGHGWVMEDNDG